MAARKTIKSADQWLFGLKPRWMDLIGDYAGDEFFVVDGDSLCQIVLDDENLAIGDEDTPCFQIIHAIHTLERLILDLTKRNCNFEIVFFESNKHATILTGDRNFTVSSRFLARNIMKSHILQLSGVTATSFKDLGDPMWEHYVNAKQPMFIFCHIGSSLESMSGDRTIELSRALIQRTFVYDVLTSRIAVSLLNETKFIDSKILSFVYERQRIGHNKTDVSDWIGAYNASMKLCEKELTKVIPNPTTVHTSDNRAAWLAHAVQAALDGSSSAFGPALALAFLGSQLILPYLSIEQRAQQLWPLDSKLRKHLVTEFYPKTFSYLGSTLANTLFFPDLDGNIFLAFLNCVIGSGQHDLGVFVGASLAQEITATWAMVGVPLPDLSILSSCFKPKIVGAPSMVSSPLALLPFSHPLFDKYLPALSLDSAPESTTSSDLRTRLDKLCDEPFVDGRHWHSSKSILPKRLGGVEDQEASAQTSWQRMKQLRKDQRFMTNLQRHAQTLTGALGRPIQRMVILEPETRKNTSKQSKRGMKSEPSDSSHAQPPKLGKASKSKPPQLSSADKLRAKIEAEKQGKKSSEDEIWWTAQLKELNKAKSLADSLARIENISRTKRVESGWLDVEVSLYRIHLTFLTWIADEQRTSDEVCERYTVRILRSIHLLREHVDLFPAAARLLGNLLSILGFESFNMPKERTQDTRKLGFDFVELTNRKGRSIYRFMRIESSPVEFQLKTYGVFMDRSMGGAADPRVAFKPDGWQRQVLDKIDRKESVLVVAPTSAGKTFSSFYAMEKVLRESNDGVVVYVSPTKALCQQIAADIYARFSKNMTGKTVWAINTRDFRVHDPLKAQILVTVPDILSIMLLSPSIANVWASRLKLIILDEIHSIGQLDGGQVWEHIILLSRCPILGLSATIGQPGEFSSWLGSVQKEHDAKYSMVEHTHRYSHLRKHVWQIQSPDSDEESQFEGLGSPRPDSKKLRVLHPMSALLLGGRTIPPDLALEAQDCLSLYEMMLGCVAKGELERLAPAVYFNGEGMDFLKQADVIRYEEALKELVIAWSKAPDAEASNSPYQRLLKALQDDMLRGGEVDTLQESYPRKVETTQFIYLLHRLDSDGDLPCLAFNLDRSGCEDYAKQLLRTLEAQEKAWRESDPLWVEKLKQWEAWKAKSKDRRRDAEKASRQKRDDTREDPSDSWQSLFDPNEPSTEFSFASTGSGYSKEELRKDVGTLKWQKTPPYLVSALQRGIAVHHAGMPKGYRSLVESLFRIGYCRVVISTGTLALGINAPAKSVIFLGDSPYLTALMYRQCAGRAGRRGFDLLGKVIFYNLPLDRIHRLMLSRIPPLTGNWPLTTTLCLRLFNLLTGSHHAPSAVSAIDSFLRLPRLSVSSDQSRAEVLHHMRFSIDYLRRSRLLTDDGRTTALFPIVGQLYFEEPGNLAFAALVRAGVLHELCSKYRENQPDTERGIVHLVATLFARRPLPYSIVSDEVLETRRKSSPSRIKLAPLPPHVVGVLEQHNQEVLRVFSAYAVTYATQYLSNTPDNVLPLSKHGIGLPSKLSGNEFVPFINQATITSRSARSCFVSNSGLDDTFSSIDDLTRSARSGLHLNGHSIPSFDYAAPVNAYALDYWMHESVRPLVDANGLRRGDVWFALQNFSLTLATLVTSLKTLLIDGAVEESKEEMENGEVGEGDWDAAQGTDKDDEDREFPELPTLDSRPSGVPDDDWMVYEAFQSVAIQFNEKWRKMWA
ncbi:P-loop containing nucleoside triphosphate hydrolase protein [Ceratobasidium sp. AG-I]|nr:P-loop containing nucleoside triphosphate hydrolase protein [Ceratobasidium sp. AG-I]